MINSVTISGRLTKEVEYKATQSGVKVARFTLAVQRSYKDKNGDYQADFINIIAFRGAADIANNYLNKGDLCNVHGRIQTRNFENDNGQRVFLTEVVSDDIQLINTSNDNNQQSYSQNTNNQPQQQRGQSQPQNNWQQQQNNQQGNPFANANGPIDISDEDLPF
ncbi:TPA: single-stranded DNA-binding protein [Staphylococcus aureus]|nr:single-stranded DNA-binding protein [Staphylococcus aureus]